MAGLRQDTRHPRPTDRTAAYHLGEPTLRIGNVTDPPIVQITHSVQLHFLGLLGIEVIRTRWPRGRIGDVRENRAS